MLSASLTLLESKLYSPMSQICTEVLYQPLTLIDCLHTFCGSCLKEWFRWQYNKAKQSRNSSASSLHPYTCPSCRATVKDARHNAQVATLLGMFLAQNPDRGKSEQEKEEMAKNYKTGESILPKLKEKSERKTRREFAEEAADRRQIEEARERSLREMRAEPATNHQLALPSDRGARSRSEGRESQEQRGEREREQRRHRRREDERRERRRREAHAAAVLDTSVPAAVHSPPATSPRHPQAVEARQRDGHIAHQPSLRSLVSASESGTGTGDSLDEDLILRQIIDEGLLDGIDLHNLDAEQTEEISERIAQAYRERHQLERQTSPRQSLAVPANISTPQERSRHHERTPSDRHHRRARSAQDTTTPDERQQAVDNDPRRPPVASRQFLENAEQLPRQRPSTTRRSSDNSAKPVVPPPATRHTSDVVSRTSASRSATDLSDRPHTSENHIPARNRQLSEARRTNTEPEQGPKISDIWKAGGDSSRLSQNDSPRQSPHLRPSVVVGMATTQQSSPAASFATPATSPQRPTTPRLITSPAEPSIKCDRCERPDIQYDVFMHCDRCVMDICQRCYRDKKGCNHWFGFGPSAMTRFEASHPKRHSIEPPHVMVGRRYLKPDSDKVATLQQTQPSNRLQEGKFCDRCHNFANACYWSCDYCNDGEWGFCNQCVNNHLCCTHPLLPTAHKSFRPQRPPHPTYDPARDSVTVTPSQIHAAINQSRPVSGTTSSDYQTPQDLDEEYLPLTFTTNCDICSHPIPPSESRLHCPSHPTPTSQDPQAQGDYDICVECYSKLLKSGRISRDDGPNGWRKCPSGHRMIVIGFESDMEAQRRLVLNDLIGGHRMKEEDVEKYNANKGTPPVSGTWSWTESYDGRKTSRARALSGANGNGSSAATSSSKFPPEGGEGRRCLATYRYYPEEGEAGKGELMFPRGAEVREVEDINEEWSSGVYMGASGLFLTAFTTAI